VLVFSQCRARKLIGYIFPLLPAFAILVGPWCRPVPSPDARQQDAVRLCTIAMRRAHVTPVGPSASATAFKSRIAADDNVVFIGGYFFDVAVVSRPAHADLRNRRLSDGPKSFLTTSDAIHGVVSLFD